MKTADSVGIVPSVYLDSSWPGKIRFVSEDGTVTQLKDTSGDSILQNDFSVLDGTVIVSNWVPGTVTALTFQPG